MVVKDKNELTPIEEYHGIYYKRDDLFVPYEDLPISGGKVRQCIELIENQLDKIRNEYNNTVISGVSVGSPQGIIITRVAKEYSVNSILVYGNSTEEKLRKHTIVRNALKYCTRLDDKAGMAYETVLTNRIQQIFNEDKKKYFHIKFGINLDEDADAIVGSVSRQCENIPNDTEILIVPTGSAIMLGGIIKGVKRFNKNCEVIGIQISGYDRKKTVWNILNNDTSYNYGFIIDKTFPYSKHLSVNITNNFKLDPVYEAKAWLYMAQHILKDSKYKGKKFLFWVVGDSNAVREKDY